MTRSLRLITAVALSGASCASALVQNTQKVQTIPTRLQMTSSVGKEIETTPVASRRVPEMSEAIPFLAKPAALDGELAGDVGFDPLGFAPNKERLWELREAEIKHARLAMLAAVGWPASELFDKEIADHFGLPAVLDATDRAPSLFNGGIERISPVWWGFCLGLTAAIDLYGVARARTAGMDSDYIPGDLGFDPLGMYPLDKQGKKNMQLAEIKHGRLAMVGSTGFAVQEAATKIGVVDETPFFFQPIAETASRMMESV